MPLPAIHFAACLIVGGTRRTIVRMNWVRTCSRTGQILWLPCWLTICLGMTRWRQRLAVGTIHRWRLSDTAPDSVGRYESLCLRGHRREDAVLVEPHAIGAATIFCGLKARTADLNHVSMLFAV